MPLKGDARNVIPLGFALSTLGIVLVGTLAYYAVARTEATQALVVESAVRVTAIERLHQELLDAESMGRLFLVRGDPRFQAAYKQKTALIDDELRSLRRNVADIPGLEQELAELEQRISRRFALLDGMLELRVSRGVEAIQKGPIGPGVAEMEAIRAAIEQMKASERSTLAQRIAARTDHVEFLKAGLAALMVFGIMVMALIFRYMDRLWRARIAAEASATHLAHHDALTGLPNRRLLSDRMKINIARARRHGHSLAVLCLDLDGFKGVNDRHGHECGDRLLREVAARLRGQLREEDTVARLGGDEFVIALAHLADAAYATAVADKIIRALSAPYHLNGVVAVIGTSVGIALHPQDGTTEEELLRRGDAALYQAKAAGKGRYCLASELEPAAA